MESVEFLYHWVWIIPSKMNEFIELFYHLVRMLQIVETNILSDDGKKVWNILSECETAY